jgi:hypothetical protein
MISTAPAHTQTERPSSASSTDLPKRYVRIPQRLLTSAMYHPLLIGIYSLVARLFLISKAPVPLSAADVLRYDPALSRGAAQRVLTSLTERGWLIATECAGQKSTYVPSWGRINGVPVPWVIGELCLDRPRHVRAVCLDLRLLDLFLGRLTPHPKRAAVITRYVTAPLLALADVGSYALLLGGLPGTTPSLRAWGLTRDEQPLPLPDDAVILARASQRGLVDGNDTSLTARGLQKVGLLAPPSAPETAQPLFFVPPEVIADWPIQWPTNVIASSTENEASFSAPQRGNKGVETPASGITWESSGSTNIQQDSTTPGDPVGGGKNVRSHEQLTRADRPQTTIERSIPNTTRPAPILPTTDSAKLLAAMNVLPDQIAELADTPLAIVQEAIRDGQSRPQVRNLAGWVVKLLRTQRDQGWKIEPPTPDPQSPEALRAVFARYAAEQEAAHAERLDEDAALPPPVAPAPLTHASDRMEVWHEVLATLKLQIPRQEFTTCIQPATLHAIEEGIATIAVPNVRVKEAIEGRYRAPLRNLLTQYVGSVVTLQVILNGAHDAPAAPVDNHTVRHPAVQHAPCTPDASPTNRPDWICAERWETLPAMLRAALIGSTVVDGHVHAASPYAVQLLHGRYAEAVTLLLQDTQKRQNSGIA